MTGIVDLYLSLIQFQSELFTKKILYGGISAFRRALLSSTT